MQHFFILPQAWIEGELQNSTWGLETEVFLWNVVMHNISKPDTFSMIPAASFFLWANDHFADFVSRKAIALMKEQKMPKHDSARLERRVEKLMAGHREEVDSGDGSGF